MNRRGFLQGILALGAAPAIVRADSLMRIVPRGAVVINPFGLSLTIAEFEEKYLKPAVNAWAEEIEASVLRRLA